MPFLRKMRWKSNNSTAHSLRAYLDTDQGGHALSSFRIAVKRVSWAASVLRYRAARGSMTLEAAFALPLFLFAVINIMFLINIIGTESRIGAALHQTGNRMAFAGYVYDRVAGDMLPEGVAGVVMTYGYARGQVTAYAGEDYLNRSCIEGGSAGLSFFGSDVPDENDRIDLQVSYRVNPFSGVMGAGGFTISQRYYGRAWTGYDVTQFVSDMQMEDPMVFITETGEVYHCDRNCSYLNPSVSSVPALTVDERRNASGGRYYPCEICGAGMGSGQVYITQQGTAYHSRLSCSGLRRTIYTVPLSQVGTRGRCSGCG